MEDAVTPRQFFLEILSHFCCNKLHELLTSVTYKEINMSSSFSRMESADIKFRQDAKQQAALHAPAQKLLGVHLKKYLGQDGPRTFIL